jgi:hypothetical protein
VSRARSSLPSQAGVLDHPIPGLSEHEIFNFQVCRAFRCNIEIKYLQYRKYIGAILKNIYRCNIEKYEKN